MRHTEQEGVGGGEEEIMLSAKLATKRGAIAYRKSEMIISTF